MPLSTRNHARRLCRRDRTPPAPGRGRSPRSATAPAAIAPRDRSAYANAPRSRSARARAAPGSPGGDWALWRTVCLRGRLPSPSAAPWSRRLPRRPRPHRAGESVADDPVPGPGLAPTPPGHRGGGRHPPPTRWPAGRSAEASPGRTVTPDDRPRSGLYATGQCSQANTVTAARGSSQATCSVTARRTTPSLLGPGGLVADRRRSGIRITHAATGQPLAARLHLPGGLGG